MRRIAPWELFPDVGAERGTQGPCRPECSAYSSRIFTDTKTLLRVTGTLGATFTIVATFLPWYEFAAILRAGSVTHIFDLATTLWTFTTVAPILIVVGGSVALVCFAILESSIAGILNALIGLAIAVYAVVRCVDVPALGVVAGGTLLALAGGLMMMIAAVGELWWTEEPDDELPLDRPRRAGSTFDRRRRVERRAPRPLGIRAGGVVVKVRDVMKKKSRPWSPTRVAEGSGAPAGPTWVSGIPVMSDAGQVLGVISEAGPLAKDADEHPQGESMLRRLLGRNVSTEMADAGSSLGAAPQARCLRAKRPARMAVGVSSARRARPVRLPRYRRCATP